jgi:hypothetical protein
MVPVDDQDHVAVRCRGHDSDQAPPR